MSIEKVQDGIIKKFKVLDDWNDAYEYIIKIGKSLREYPEEFKTDSYIIKGCQSKVWIKADYIDGKMLFLADSDTAIIKGITGIIIEVLSNNTPHEILNADLRFMEEIGLKNFLAPTRANGVLAMIKQIQEYSILYLTNKSV